MKITVDLAAIYHNAVFVRKSSGVALCAVVKSDAYGHGLEETVRALDGVADFFAAATYGEALRIRKTGVKSDVFILGADGTNGERNIIPTVVSLDDYAGKSRLARFSVAVNTGMNRYGLNPNELEMIAKNGKIKAFSVFSHIFNAKYALKQAEIFNMACDRFEPYTLRHLYASNYAFAENKYDFIRAGIALYGYGYEGGERAMTVEAKVVRVAFVKAGEFIGYGDCVTPCDMEIATVDAGYGDGYPRLRKGEERHAVINGFRVKIIGQVCMDAFFADVTGLKVKAGDDVVLIGDDYDAADAAKERSTIAYEVLTSFKPRQAVEYK